MHILLIHQFFLKDHDGGGMRWNEMSRFWVEAGHHVTVITGTGHYMDPNCAIKSGWAYRRIVNKDGVKVIECPIFRSGKSSFIQKLLSFISFTFTSIWAGLFLAKEKYDSVLVSSPPLFVGLAGIVLSKCKRIPFLFEVRDLWPESAIETGVLKNRYLIKLAFWLERLIYLHSRCINVLTPAFREILISCKNVRPEKIIYIPNAADFSLAEEVTYHFDQAHFRKAHDLAHRFILVYVGAHGIANHLIQLIEAAVLLQGTSAYFVFIGNGEEKPMLLKDAQRRKLNNVRFLDKMSKREVLAYILAADMGISVLQKREIFKTIYSNKTFDYFSCKKPVLMMIDGCSRTLIEEARAGIFVEPENPEDLATKIRSCISDHHVLSEMGMNGYVYAQQNFDREVLARRYLVYLEKI